MDILDKLRGGDLRFTESPAMQARGKKLLKRLRFAASYEFRVHAITQRSPLFATHLFFNLARYSGISIIGGRS